MAFTPNDQLTPPKGANYVLRSYQHASRIFVEDQFALLPKSSHLFHVVFDINQSALSTASLQKHMSHFSLLVKKAGMPEYTMSATTLNQYNRKAVVQATHSFKPLVISFHNDNIGVINELWRNYYSYYYADPAAAAAQEKGSYQRNAMQNANTIKTPYGHNGRSERFFNSITVYHMARHEYVSYSLVNPIISSFGHSSVEYAAHSGGGHEFEMTVIFEAVEYDTGVVSDIPGFDQPQYDNTKSPIDDGSSNPTRSPTFVVKNKSSLASGGSAMSSVNRALGNVVTNISKWGS